MVFDLELVMDLLMDIGARKVGRDAHPCISEAVEDVNFAHGGGCWGIRNSLQHRIGERWKNVMDLGEEKWKESIVAVAEDGEKGHELVEIVSRAEGEWVWVRREKRQDVGQ